jgi:hypothetical protein
MKSVKPVRLHRRTVLRGAGISFALPLLDAMVTDDGLLHGPARAAVPVRFFMFMWPNGPQGTEWAPSDAKLTPSSLSPCMKVFAPEAGRPDILPYLNVLGGIGAEATWKSGHSCAMMACGHGTASDHNNSGNWPVTPTIDQLIAEKHAAATPRAPSLVLGVNRAAYDTPGLSSISWRAGSKIIMPERNPKVVFDRLFSGGGQADDPAVAEARRRRQSVLDFIREDGKRLGQRLGVADRAKVEEHMDAVRSFEQQYLKAPEGGACQGEAPVGDVDKAMLKLIVMAFKCDITRVASFMLDASGQRKYPNSPGGGDHDLSHTHDKPAKVIRTNVKLKFLADALRDMAAHKEGGKTLLDNALVYSNSDVRDGSHGRDPDRRRGFVGMPIVLAGRAGGALEAGRFVDSKTTRPLSDVLCSLLNYAGVRTEKYGANGTGPLAGL